MRNHVLHEMNVVEGVAGIRDFYRLLGAE